ncbi:MAG: DNA-3-methyladenine glycosylase 2 family protein [Chloroflexi bacterium]|nr:DNA-3-methyladenine glycosylase 2 family protein [Chloroflexota bacterium]
MAARRLPFSLARAEAHLRQADEVLARLMERHGRFSPRPGTDPYNALLRTILYQQLAGAAARTIERRWRGLYGDEAAVPAPEAVLATSDEAFRAAGVSRQKAAYLRDLAAHVVDGRLDFAAFARTPDDEVLHALTAVHGLGAWSAQMFLMFELGRPDVLPVGDLGVRRGMQLEYGLPAEPTPERVREIAGAWAPYRSVGSWYMWRAVEG